MKITLSRLRERATVLLMVVLTTLAVVLGGCTIYKIAKMVRRVDGIQDRRFKDETGTNTTMFLPPGTPSSVKVTVNSFKYEDRDVPYEPPGLMDKSLNVVPLISVNISMCLSNDGNVSLTIIPFNTSNWINRKLSDIMPLDVYGFPVFDTAPSYDDISVELQSTTNLTNWETIFKIGLSTNKPKIFQDIGTISKFYRTAQY